MEENTSTDVTENSSKFTKKCIKCGKLGWVGGEFPPHEEQALARQDRLFIISVEKNVCVVCMYK